MSPATRTTRRPGAGADEVAPRRVLVSSTRAWASPIAVRAALAQAWGDGCGVLVTGARRGAADRMAERVWRSWGGRVERHPHRWSLHRHTPDHPAGATTRYAAGADVCVDIGANARVSSHDDCSTAVDRARRAVEALTRQEHADEQEHDDTAEAADNAAHDAAEDDAVDDAGDERGDQ